MLLLSKVRDFTVFCVFSGRPCEAVRGRVRLWEAVWGCAPLIGLEICPSQSGEHGLSRPLTFGLTWPLIASASHNLSCDLSEPIREHGLSRTQPPTASQIWESDRPHRSDSGRSNAFSREISQIAPRIGLSAGVRERPIGLYRARQCV